MKEYFKKLINCGGGNSHTRRFQSMGLYAIPFNGSWRPCKDYKEKR